jgi:hypothetical protein
MAKKTNGVPKKKILDVIHSLGLQIARVKTLEGNMVWELSNGERFNGWSDIAKKFKVH